MTTISRSDIYGRVHKGLRKAMFDLAYEAGKTDYTDPGEWARLKARTADVIHFLERHGYVEDTYQLPMIEAKVPGITQVDADEHEEVHRELEEIQGEMARIDMIDSPEERRAAGEDFYLMINRFISGYLQHMNREEVEQAPHFVEHCTPEDIQRMTAAIVAGNSPQETMLMLRYTIPAVDPVERASFLRHIRQTAPPPAFQAVMNLVEQVLSGNEWLRLNEDMR